MPRSAIVRGPSAVAIVKSPFSRCSSSRSTTATGRSASMRSTASPRPAAAGDPSSRVRSSAGFGDRQVARARARRRPRTSSRAASRFVRRDRPMPGACHASKNGSNTSWTNCPCRRGSITSSSSGSSSSLSTCCAKNLNGQSRYVSSALTDQARGGDAADRAVEIGRVGRRPRRPQLGPGARVAVERRRRPPARATAPRRRRCARPRTARAPPSTAARAAPRRAASTATRCASSSSVNVESDRRGATPTPADRGSARRRRRGDPFPTASRAT